MAVFDRENAIIGVCVLFAVAAWFLIKESEEFGASVSFGALLVVGVGLPSVLLYLLPGESYFE